MAKRKPETDVTKGKAFPRTRGRTTPITPRPRNEIHAELVEPTKELPVRRPSSTSSGPRHAAPTSRRRMPKLTRRQGQAIAQAGSEYAWRSAVRSSGGRPSVAGRAVGGAAAGAATGATLGSAVPVIGTAAGAAGGAVVGAAGGAVSGRKERRAYDKAAREAKGTAGPRRVILAEFTVCMAIAALAPLARKEDSPGRLIRQLTALMLMFFILAIVSNFGRGPARFGAAVGGVVTLVLVTSERNLLVKLAEMFNRPPRAPVNTGGVGDDDVVTV